MYRAGYKYSSILGRGTYGTVFKCKGPNGEDCCVKKISLVKANEATTVQHTDMIKKEIYLLQNLNHPRIIRFLTHFTLPSDNNFYIVMEYASNGSLSKSLVARRARVQFLSENEILHYLTDIIMGVEFLHMKGVIHKDLKTENILIGENNRLKIADFGVSTIANNTSVNTSNKENEFHGSPIYMAPEILSDQKYSFESDIWALGCILYELCMLRNPFSYVVNFEDLIHCVKKKLFKPINCKLRNYNEKINILCDCMLTVEPEQRATLQQIISHPLITYRMYENYFNFEDSYNIVNFDTQSATPV